MAITDSDSTVGEIVNEVGSKLASVSADVQRWAEAVDAALAATPDSSAPEPSDPSLQLPSPDSGTQFQVPDKPSKPNTSFSAPRNPDRYTPADIDRFQAPQDPSYSVTFSDVFETYEPGAKPDLPTYTAPTVVVPDLDPAPTIDGPAPVTLTQTQAPTWGGLTLPSFEISLDEANLPTLSNAFSYVEDPFSPTVLNDVVTQARVVLGGSGFLPSSFWEITWSSNAGVLKRQELAAVREASRAHASAGWMMPGAVLLSREAAARQKSHEALSAMTQDINQKRTALAHEDMLKAMDVAVQCETILLQAHTQGKDRTLRAAVEANNAGITVYNAALEAYKATKIMAAEFLLKLKDLQLRGSLAEIQEFEADLKAAGFNLEYDRNQVELYKAQWGGEDTKAKAYAAYADAIRAYVQGQAAAVDAFGKQIESNNTILQGWSIEWDAYLKRLKPAELRIEAFKARDAHLGTLVQEYSAKVAKEGARAEVDFKVEGLGFQEAAQEIEQYKAIWAGIQTRLDALTKVYGTEAQVYQAIGSVESSRVQAINQRYDIDVRKAGVELQRQIAGLQTRMGYWDRWMQSWVTWNTATAGAYAQLGGAAYTAMNYSLGANGNTSYSNSYSKSDSTTTDYNYDMTG